MVTVTFWPPARASIHSLAGELVVVAIKALGSSLMILRILFWEGSG